MSNLRPRTSHAVRIVSREASASRLPDAKGCARLTGCYGSLWETGARRGEKWGKGEDGHQLLHVVSHVDATSTSLGQNGPKRAGGLRTRSHGAGRASDFAWGVTPCRRASRFLGYFDGQRSHTNAEHVMRCPGCGVKPDNDAFKAGYGVARRS